MNKLSKFEIIEQSFKLIQTKGWNDYSLEKVATEYKYKINDVKSLIKNKDNLLFEFSKMINERVESNIDINDFNDSDIKDNLFELLMMRFDIMNSYKKALKRIINEVKNPIILKKISHNILESMDFYLEFSNAYDRSVFDFFKKIPFSNLFLLF